MASGKLLWRLFVFGSSLSATGLSVSASADDAFLNEMPIVLSASRLEQSALDAPTAVTVIDRELIAASGFTEIHDLLRLVPGFLVADWPDGQPVVASYGVGDAHDRRIKVMIDGQTVNSPYMGSTNWQDLPLRVDDIERIEVVRGPNGAAYGVNAFQAVINIITRSPAAEDGAALRLTAGRAGFRDHSFRLNGKADESLSWRLSGSWREMDSFRSWRNPRGELGSGKALERRVLNFTSSAQLDLHDELNLMLGLSDGDTEQGTPGDGADPVRTARMRARYLHLGWTHRATVDAGLSVQLHHQTERNRSAWMVMASGSPPVPADENYRVGRDALEIQYHDRLAADWRYLLGAGIHRERAHSRTMFNGDGGEVSGINKQLFGSVVWTPLPPLQLDLGATLEDHHYSGSLWSPRFSVRYQLNAVSALRASVGQAYRAPSLVEANAEQVVKVDGQIKRLNLLAAADMKPERMRHAELGYVAIHQDLGLDVNLRAFHRQYEDYIDDQRCWYPDQPWEPVISSNALMCPQPSANFFPFEHEFMSSRRPRSFIFLNGGRFHLHGVEASVGWQRPGWGRVQLSHALTGINARRATVDSDFEQSVPRNITSLLLIKDLPARWRVSAGYYRHSTMYWLNDGDRVSARGRFDLKLSHSFGPAARSSEIAFVVQSLRGSYPDFHEGKHRHQQQLFATLMLNW